MLHIRPFCNFDPPAVAAIWQRCAGQPGLAQPVSVDLFERLVFGKLYFPESGFFLAFDGDQPVGFAHAGFGPSQDRRWISTETGIVCMLLVCPDCPEPDKLALDLLSRCEEFLAGRGARRLLGGCVPPDVPFYAGLYGGSMPPGILATDRFALSAFGAAGYEGIDRTLVFRRSLMDFRPLVDRRTMQIRRTMQFTTIVDPPPRDWWEAATIGEFDLTRFELAPPKAARPAASLTVRDMGPPSPDLPGPAAGILDLFVDPALRRQGLATFLLGEAFKQLMNQGVGSVEAHLSASDRASAAFCNKLGLRQAAEAVRFRKDG
ncbi:MAG: GNAT family N-acetyltransferase [Thermoguttaceae bacterium]|jgi:ribosomal protein S18 acetylase RimI-like enzyme